MLVLERDPTPTTLTAATETRGTVYAIAFDLDQAALAEHYSMTASNAYAAIRSILESRGFRNQQGSVYFADTSDIDAVHTVITVQKIAKKYDWFHKCVRDIRMLRIEDNNDLMPAIESAIGMGDQGELGL